MNGIVNMKTKLHQIRAYLNDDEYHQFKLRVAAHGGTESGVIREALSFEIRLRGAPKGTARKRKVGRPKTKKTGRTKRIIGPLFEFDDWGLSMSSPVR